MTQATASLRVSTFAHVRTMAKYAFLNYFRARRFYVILAIVLAMSALLTFAAAYFRSGFFGFGLPEENHPQLAFYSAWWGSFVPLVTLLSAVFFGGDAISGEFQNKTGYFLVPNPVRRSAIYVGKWLAAFGAAGLVLGVFALIALANATYFFGFPVQFEFIESVAFAYVNLVAVLTLTFLFSSLFKSSALSVLMTVIVLLFALNIVDTIVASIAGIEPWFSITYAGGIISNVLHIPYPQGVQTPPGPPGFRVTVFSASILEGLVIMAAYFVVSGLLGLFLFEKKELT
ncbi:MAG: ABC transporter permease [archaeon]|nr:MAG: ABC transporter permease [archaeon]